MTMGRRKKSKDPKLHKRLEKNFFVQAIKAIVRTIKYGDSNTKRFWDDILKKYNNFGRVEHYSYFFDLLPKNKKFSLLDVGCAVGDGCVLIKKKFPLADVTGLDQSTVGIEIAKKKEKSIKYIARNLLKGDIPGHYDYITLVDTLEHFHNPFPILDNCLKHADSVIVRVPYKQKLPFKRLRHHKYSFDENTFKDYNCRIVKITKDPDVKGDHVVYQFFK